MSSDRSRRTDPTRNGYTGVVAQQGRVILDRDFNDQQGLAADRTAADALAVIGPCGTPDDGFRISLPGGSPPPPPFWTPVEPPASPPGTEGGAGDFLIAPGTMYLGGQRIHWAGEQAGKAITYSYFDQPDWPAPPPPQRRDERFRRELVWLEVAEQEVSAVEDPDLLEVALGGPDTTQRLKLLGRVHRAAVAENACGAAWQEATAAWASAGWTFDPATMRLRPQTTLKIGFSEDASSGNLCDPVATGGYMGADNQTIRIRIAGDRLLWGYDNASFIYRIAALTADGTTITLATDPPDTYHYPQTGQIVEILTTAALFGAIPDETNPSAATTILRVAAEADGLLRALKQPYGPLPSGTANVIVLTEALPSSIGASGLPLFLRVWQAAIPVAATGGTYDLDQTLTDPNTGVTTTVLNTGLTATIAVPKGGHLADGAFWIVAARPSTPQGVYPETLLTAPQFPDGPRRWACPLAVIDWENGTVTDCRNPFDNLVVLSRRKPGCCTIGITPTDLAGATLQSLIDTAAAQAETVTVCLAAGVYPLPGTLYLDSRHNGLTLESCGGAAILNVVADRDPAAFTDGLVALVGVVGVTLRGLTLAPPLVLADAKFYDATTNRVTQAGFDQAAAFFRRPYTSVAVRAIDAPDLTLDACVIILADDDPDRAAETLAATSDVFAVAVWLQGTCLNPKIRDCNFSTTLTPTFTWLAAQPAEAPPVNVNRFQDLLHRELALPSSPPAASPPAAPVNLDEQVSQRLELLVAGRAASDATRLSFATVTAGLLAADAVAADCALGEASLRDSVLTGFTFAVYVSAALSALRLQDNQAASGVAGFWLEVPGFRPPPEAAEGTAIYDSRVRLFAEYQLLTSLAASAPLPRGAPSRPAHIDEILFLPPTFWLTVSGNQIATRLPSQGASAALLLALYPAPPARVVRSVIVAANSLAGGLGSTDQDTGLYDAAIEVPAALLTLPNGLPCSITGNIVLNLDATTLTEVERAPSLWISVANFEKGTELLAVTGNVLRGVTDLRALFRFGAGSGTVGWLPENAAPG